MTQEVRKFGRWILALAITGVLALGASEARAGAVGAPRAQECEGDWAQWACGVGQCESCCEQAGSVSGTCFGEPGVCLCF
jgi:hypothetical protein